MTAREVSLPVSELILDTIQGEGPAAGRAASFVRLMGCNLSCSWCDSAYTWDAARFDLRGETHQMTPRYIADRLGQAHARIAVLTGGEPLLRQREPGFTELLTLLDVDQFAIHVETNGTIAPSERLWASAQLICVSPKLPHAGRHRGHQDPRLHPMWAQRARIDPGIHLKVVVTDEADVAQVLALATTANWPLEQVWVMPEGEHPDVLAARWPAIAAAAAERGINASHRLHVLAWGAERGH